MKPGFLEAKWVSFSQHPEGESLSDLKQDRPGPMVAVHRIELEKPGLDRRQWELAGNHLLAGPPRRRALCGCRQGGDGLMLAKQSGSELDSRFPAHLTLESYEALWRVYSPAPARTSSITEITTEVVRAFKREIPKRVL